MLHALRKGRKLEGMDGVGLVNGRFDLRGLAVPRPEVTGSSAFKNYELSFLSGRIEFRRIILDNADLSYSDFTDVIWKNCNLSNVDFRSARLRGVGFWSCSLTNISFDGSDLRDAVLDGANGSSPSSFVDVNFCKVNLESTGGGLPLFRNCDFSNANLRKVDFDGARFENCKFAGLLYDVAFRPHASIYVASALPWQRLDPKKFTNRMEFVDFSQADLRYVGFNGVDLSSCTFPCDENHLVIRSQRQVFLRAVDVISSEWQDPERTSALRMIDNIYIRPGIREGRQPSAEQIAQPIEVVNRLDLRETLKPGVGDRVFDLLRVLAA